MIDPKMDALFIRNSAAQLVDACYGAANRAGWWLDPGTGADVRTWNEATLKLWIGTKLCLVHSEVSEALEGLRKGKQDEHLPDRKSFEVELADAVIRIFDLAGGLEIDLPGAIAEKLAYNARRADHQMANRKAEGGKAF